MTPGHLTQVHCHRLLLSFSQGTIFLTLGKGGERREHKTGKDSEEENEWAAWEKIWMKSLPELINYTCQQMGRWSGLYRSADVCRTGWVKANVAVNRG